MDKTSGSTATYAAPVSTMKPIRHYLAFSIPKAGISHFIETYLTWFSVGFVSSFVAGALDKYAGVAYASYYTGAVNEAVGFNFWVLLSVIGLLLFAICLPIQYVACKFEIIHDFITKLRQFTYTFFLVAFDEGGLMIGILFANYFDASDRTAMLASKSFLFSGVGLFSIVVLAVFNSLLWFLGEAIFNREDKSFSGIVSILVSIPVRIAAPSYIAAVAILVYLVVAQ
jgi:general stress protein CsbA